MLAVFLLVVGHNTRYCLIRKTFDRSHYNTSQNFNKVLKALHSIVADMMVKPGAAVPEKIRESTRFYPYFKDCIGAIDGTHIPATVFGRDTNSYRNRHGTISQNVLAACNFDLEFIYVLSGWEGSAHDSSVLTDALSRNNGLKVPQVLPSSSEQVYEDGNFDQLFDTQEQQRANANAWRDAIANQMWSDVEHVVNIN
ncbi:uncharacterized protein [Henckelia pumila]|uniref:uncharacterized protein n=1 Tax=Henckelia pumila TaxID=405737 RepID=UPI003C6E8ECC